MPFNSYSFVLFFIVVLTSYHALTSWRSRKVLLLLASYIFYAAWNPPFVILLWISTGVDWFLARIIHRQNHQGKRRLLLTTSLAVNLGLLGYFKYGGFLLENFTAVLQALGVQYQAATPNIILPVGISFYTFQTLSYTLDVYRKKLTPWHSPLDYALYVTFFPQLVAGPIVRASDFLPQCQNQPHPDRHDLSWGLSLMTIGLFQKIVLADGLLAPVVEAVYDSTEVMSSLSVWVATAAFAGQIFCDFSGYSLCAIGAAMCLGFGIPDNFRFPLAAVGFSDFWRRWHISLSTWLRDYLYIPLGGNRCHWAWALANLMITMLLGGLWHGARWTFVVWGGLHGLYLILERLAKRLFTGAWVGWLPIQFTLGLLTFGLVNVAWVFFRADSFGQAFAMIRAMLGLVAEEGVGLDKVLMIKGLVVMTCMFLAHWWMRQRTLEVVAARMPWILRALLLSLMWLGIVLLTGEDRAFIYFQF